MHDFRLDEKSVGKLAAANEKVRALGEKRHKKGKESEEEEGGLLGGRNIDESVRRVEKHPEIVSALKSAGLSPREFVTGTMTMMMASMWAGMEKNYPDAKRPPEINPDNVKFLQTHPEVAQKWGAGLKKGSQKGHGEDHDDEHGEDSPDDSDDAK